MCGVNKNDVSHRIAYRDVAHVREVIREVSGSNAFFARRTVSLFDI